MFKICVLSYVFTCYVSVLQEDINASHTPKVKNELKLHIVSLYPYPQVSYISCCEMSRHVRWFPAEIVKLIPRVRVDVIKGKDDYLRIQTQNKILLKEASRHLFVMFIMI